MADAESFQPETIDDWHRWLASNHDRGTGVWVVTWRTSSGHEPLPYEELIREALCWGWVDGQAGTVDELRSRLWFTRRRPNSPWAASNKARVADLQREGRLQPAGLEEIARAKASGSWTILDAAEALQEPPELVEALDTTPGARAAWDACAPSTRKQALGWIAVAKRPQTRVGRVEAIVARLAAGGRPV